MSNSNLLKSLFLLFYSISNVGTIFYIIPNLCEFLIRIDILPKWYNLGIIFSIHEIGKLFGNFLWFSFIKKKYSSTLLLIISLILLVIFNCCFIYINSFFGLILFRFIFGYINNLTLISNNIYLELKLKKKFVLILYIMKNISVIISIFIPAFLVKINLETINKYHNLYSLIQSLINIITLIITFVMIKLKILNIKSNRNFIQMNSLMNEYDNSLKTGKKLNNIESSKNKNNSNYKKKIINLNINSNDDTNPNSAERKINNEEKQFNRFYSNNNNSKEIDSINNYQNINKREQTGLISKNDNDKTIKQKLNIQLNLDNLSILNNPSILKKIKFKEIKLSFIIIFFNLNDSILLIWTIIFLYIECNWNAYKFAIYFSCYNFIFYFLNYIFTRRIINKLSKSHRKIISFEMKIYLIILLIFSMLGGVLIFIYYLKYFEKFKTFIFLGLIVSTLVRNIINSICIQMFQIYCTIDFNAHSTNIEKFEKLKRYLSPVFKSFFIILSSLSYHFLSLENELEILDLILVIKINSYFIIYPIIPIILILIFRTLYMIN